MPSTYEFFVLLLAAAIFSFCAVPVSERFAILGLLFLLLSCLAIVRYYHLQENSHRAQLARRDAKISRTEAGQHQRHSEWQDQLYCKDARYQCLVRTNAGLCEELAQAKRALYEAQDSLPPPTKCYRQHFVPAFELVRENADLKSRIEAKSADDAERQTLIQGLKAEVKKLSSSGKALELEAVQLKKKAAELKKKYDGAERIVGLMSRQRSGRDVKVFKDAGTQADGPAAPQVPSLGFSTVMTLVDSPPVTVAARPLMIEDNTQTPAESEQGVTGALKVTTVSGSQTGAHAPSRTVEDDRDTTISSLRKEVDELMEEVEQRCGELNQRDNDVRKLQHRLEKQTKLM